MDLGFLTTKAYDESSGISTHATIIIRPKNGAYWIMPDNVLGGATAVGMSEAKPYHTFKHKTDFQTWK